MRLQNISFYNFRNYRREGKISFDGNGKVTIIYGTNGDGKTTLHQLFRWILYGTVTFNRTTSTTKLYNLRNGANLLPESNMYVWGEIAFEHENINYLAHREWGYYKNSLGNIQRKSIDDEFYVQAQLKTKDWKRIDQPQEFIDRVLPSGLSPYFFFDGETMIADLKQRGNESAKALNTALTNLFDLYIYQRALDDIGKNTTGSSTVLGKLENERLRAIRNTGNVNAANFEKEIRRFNKKLELSYEQRQTLSDDIDSLKSRIAEISELIGTNSSKRRLEKDRELLKTTIDNYQKEISRIRLEFGKSIEETYSFLLIDAVVKDAEDRMYLKVQNEKKNLIPGLTKELLKSLLHSQEECICGRPIDLNARSQLEEWIRYFPPASYKATYDKFKMTANRHSGKFDEEKLCVSFLTRIFDKFSDVRKIENRIEEIDEELKTCGDIDRLIDERSEKEKELKEAEKEIRTVEGNISVWESQVEARNKLLKKADENNDIAQQFTDKIALVQKAYQLIFEEKLEQTKAYSRLLEKEIQDLVDTMLTSKRSVELSDSFQLRVKDSYDDESKSEGQFAVVSFAYISAILKVLQSHDRLRGKEYPLVLDGPFSKLDAQQKQNVLDILPQYANQVVILSKDSLQEQINMEEINRIYTIVSNDEKNDARIEEGYLWK